MVAERPASAQAMAGLLAEGRRARPVGAGTKLSWGNVGPPPEVELSTARLDAVVEHNHGDLTAVLQAGVPPRRAQEVFARAGQRLSLDPPDGDGHSTIGGIVATGDSGPLRHRYGAVRDLILGVQVALSDGTVARAGSKVIKNVAGYDLAKLMCGALGTLGVVCEVIVRLHPVPESSVTAVGHGTDPRALAQAARSVARRPLELEALDLRWDGSDVGGSLLARAAGRAAAETADAAIALMSQVGLATELVEDGDGLWAAQRERQRAVDGGALVRVSGLPTDLERLLGSSSSAVARPGLGLAWVRLPDDPDALDALRAALAPAPCVVLDAPESLRAGVDPWGVAEGPELALARSLKARFDPAGVCNPGRFVGRL